MLSEEKQGKTLVLVPTPFELNVLQAQPEYRKLAEMVVECCGFGLSVSAARTAQLLATYRPRKVLLIGIAGAYSDRLRIGSAYRFSEIACYGIGVGSGSEFQTAESVGWKQWHVDDEALTIGDRIQVTDVGAGSSSDRGALLSCASASSSHEDVAQRCSVFPNAVAEDMEAFSVAVACKLASVEVDVVRGISNVAGDRDQSRWKIAEALASALEVATGSLS